MEAHLQCGSNCRRAAHVGPHLVHLAGWLDGDAARVECHPLAHQDNWRRVLHKSSLRNELIKLFKQLKKFLVVIFYQKITF